ncbi:AsmA protein [Colwellia chukchiensis]|uniref:AsmA protein n=1 Tax=Colwellia chukchiensis TaxID=641665 RepID=A0A1H7J9N5_9GAMM|nr:AsmA family protein [Colwellia chukchiensis]SEK71423.1 AsmA protein [Colwellia chukchiensis]
MRIFLKFVAVIAVIIALLTLAATQLISTQDIVKQVSTKVEQTTGRALTVNGELNLQVFPSLLLELNDVHFANALGGSRAEMAKIDELELHIPWLSLFSGQLTIEKFVINNPDILLEKTAEGKVNWQFSPITSAADKVASNTKTLPEQPANNDGNLALPESFDLRLDQVEINGGTLTYIDHEMNDSKTLDQLSLAIALPSLQETLNIAGSVRYMAQVFELESSITTPAKAINNQAFSVNLALSSALAKLNYSGELLQQGQEITGKLSLAGDSVKQLLNWQNIKLEAKENAFNQFSLNTNIRFVNNTLAMNELVVKLDALAFKGSSAITLSTPLKVVSNIDLGVLDLNPYLPAISATEPTQKENSAEPIVWDNTALDLSVLKALNAEIAIQSTQLFAREIKLGENELALTLDNGMATVQLKSFEGYEGKGSGVVTLNATTKPYQFSSNFKLTDINAEPLLTDAIGFNKLMGKGHLVWQLSSQGRSQADFISQLQGDLSLNFIDGAIKGLNLAAIAKSASNIMQGNLASVSLDSDFSHAEQTDFAALTAEFTVKDGIAQSKNLSLLNPFIRVAGVGDIDLPKTTVNLQVKSKIVASVQGQAANNESSGVEIPIKITGPFHDIKIRPDVSSGAKDKLKNKVKDKLKDKLKGLLG